MLCGTFKRLIYVAILHKIIEDDNNICWEAFLLIFSTGKYDITINNLF